MSIWTDPTANPLNDNGGTGKGNGHDTSRDPNAIGATRDTAVWQGRAYVREVDGCWRDEFGRTLGRDETGWHITEPSPLWRPQPLSRWLKKTIPPREWFIEDWLPLGQCTGLYGIPGVRKSLWLLQALISGALGHHFMGLAIKTGPVLGLFCEDDDEELARRAETILRHYRRSFGELLHCHCVSLVGVTMTDFVRFTRSGRMDPTPVFTHWREQLLDLKPSLASLDVGADFFGGNENDRGQVGQFIRLLDGAFHEANCAGVFSAHPSRRGIAQGALDSGSTGWEGKVRARLVMHDPAIEEEDDEEEEIAAKMLRVARNPSNERILTRAKCNYAAPGAEIPLILKNGVFMPKNIVPGATPRTGPLRKAAADAKFLELLGKVRDARGYVNDEPSTPRHYAPTVFASHPDHGDFTKREFEKALNRLIGTGRIEYLEEKHGTGYHRNLAARNAPAPGNS